MSAERGICRFKDGTIRYFLYDGTTSMKDMKLFKTSQDLEEHWNTNNRVQISEADKSTFEEVECFTVYANGLYWRDRASRTLECFLDCHTEDTVDSSYGWNFEEMNGVPDWVQPFIIEDNIGYKYIDVEKLDNQLTSSIVS